MDKWTDISDCIVTFATEKILQILEELILSMSSLLITKIDESFQSRFSKLWGQDQSWLKETNTLSSIVFCWFNTADIIRNMYEGGGHVVLETVYGNLL